MSQAWDDEGDEDEEQRKRRAPLSNGAVFRFIFDHWMARRPRFLSVISLIAVATAADLAIPSASGRLVDIVSNPVRKADLAWSAWAVLSGLYLTFYVVRSIAFRLTNSFYAKSMQDIVVAAFERVQDYSADWHANTFAGATVRKISRSMWGFDAVSDALILMLGPTALVLVGLSVTIALRWPTIGLFTAGLVASFVAFNIWATNRFIRSANLKSNALDSRIGAVLADAMSGNPAVKSFGAEAREADRFRATVAQWRAAMIDTWNRFNLMGLGQNILLLALQTGLSGLILERWARGAASPGDVAFAITAFMLMAGYLRNVGEIVRMVQRGLDDTMDVAAYMREPPQVADPEAPEPFVATAGKIAFVDVGFSYAGQTRAVFSHFELTVQPGERVALVGPTGSGKSTFVKLLQRLYDLDAGRILIDGQDISKVRQSDLRRAVAVVPQDPALFHRSIAENIAYARPDATPDEIRLAARRAHADDFIESLPKGYDTLVGERGVKLSGGERQRVAIARAFLAYAPILVLDEATSSLDVETERAVQSAMEALMVGRTTVIIAHRLSTVRSADRILVFQKGSVVEEGRHAELVARNGVYARLTAAGEL